MGIDYEWSSRQLKERIQSMLYERTAISRKPEQTILNDLTELKNEQKLSPWGSGHRNILILRTNHLNVASYKALKEYFCDGEL